MSKTTLKTITRNTSVSRVAVREAITGKKAQTSAKSTTSKVTSSKKGSAKK